jgi:hypothetical protein
MDAPLCARHSGEGRDPLCFLFLAQKTKMDYAPLLRRALWAIGFADVRSGILPSQSGFDRR